MALITGGVQAAGNIASTLIANKANKELAQYSFDMQRQMVQEQNAYNSPVQQMARYQEAGLNPSLIYGNGSSSAGNQSTIAKYDAPRMEAPPIDLGQAVQLSMQARQLNKALELQDAQIEREKAITRSYTEDVYAKQIKNALESELTGFRPLGMNLSDEAKAGIQASRSMRSYDLGIVGQQVQQDYNRAQTALSRLNAREKDYYYNNLLPLQVKLQSLNLENMSYKNAKEAIDLTLWKELRNAEIMRNPFTAFGAIGKTIFEDTPAAHAFGDSVREIMQDPIGWKNNPVRRGGKYLIQKGKSLYQKYRKK